MTVREMVEHIRLDIWQRSKDNMGLYRIYKDDPNGERSAHAFMNRSIEDDDIVKALDGLLLKLRKEERESNEL